MKIRQIVRILKWWKAHDHRRHCDIISFFFVVKKEYRLKISVALVLVASEITDDDDDDDDGGDDCSVEK